MMVFCDHSSRVFVKYMKQHHGKLGWIFGPKYWRKPQKEIPYVLDNDAFISWKKNEPWSEENWKNMLDRTSLSGTPPLWILVPDVVANRDRTIENWEKYYGFAASFGWPLAFAVQDGMVPRDVPQQADWVFVGGSTEWKWKTARMWCQHFRHVHIGRVRTGKLQLAEEMGASSVDGSGFMRETFYGRPSRLLQAFIEGYRDTTQEMFPNQNTCLTISIRRNR